MPSAARSSLRRQAPARTANRSAPAAPVSLDDARDDAGAAGLSYVSNDTPGIVRRKNGSGFRYVDAKGRIVRDAATLKRIRGIVIPPAWSDVWISPSTRGHLQATGRDARGRKQYCYHPDFRAIRDGNKYGHMLAFGAALGKIRRRIARDMRHPGLPREKVIATVVQLLESTLIRVGNAEYARDNGSFGLTTLRDRHVKVRGAELAFEFHGKSGKAWRLHIHDRRVARIVRSCQDIPGQHLFQYVDESGGRHSIGSADVNAYLREVGDGEITAKDFRTWAGTVLAATTLRAFGTCDSDTLAKANVRAAVDEVAEQLGNTAAVCRKCYIHPAVLEAYLAGNLDLRPGKAQGRLKADEVAVFAFLRRQARAARQAPPRKRHAEMKRAA